ncbi:SAM hydrolase/SAM-dependent halogenase family protein [Singulisphaera sp. PoT]|uniref:SAM hydrolase/SAM-dependent halogenase family protein n=1 Tax=Singulisphaera sp. PoT TaxID=3411797 RepID=UPI003BF5AB83
MTTDFGIEGSYVAAMKGIILGRAPGAQIVDVTHRISPQNVLEGAFVLAEVVEAFPPGTVHLAVVDPGVGTDRKPIAVSIDDQWFVLPDNGLISAVARGKTGSEIREISNPAILRSRVSNTFHGRDIFAPAAAHLLLGRDPAELGPTRSSFLIHEGFEATRGEDRLIGHVVFRDSFGNLITNIPDSMLAGLPPENWLVEVAGVTIRGVSRTYGQNPPGTLVALIGSGGWLEVAVVNGDAARLLTVGPGAKVWARHVQDGNA